MDDNDAATVPSGTGILHCLRALAQEAATLRLLRTLSAIEDAMDMAAFETGSDMAGETQQSEPSRPVLH
jgi:hypothetical protein